MMAHEYAFIIKNRLKNIRRADDLYSVTIPTPAVFTGNASTYAQGSNGHRKGFSLEREVPSAPTLGQSVFCSLEMQTREFYIYRKCNTYVSCLPEFPSRMFHI
jgi:hypothetical protein